MKLTETDRRRVKLIKLNLYANFKNNIRDDFYYDGIIIGGKSTNAVVLLLLVCYIILLYECIIPSITMIIIHCIILYKVYYS